MADLKETVGGAVGALCCAYSGNPFDVVKVRLQTQKPLLDGSYSYKGPMSCLSRILKEEGVFALWKGVTPALSSALIENSVLFTANGVIRRSYITYANLDENHNFSVRERAIMGGLSGVCSATV
jgi:hypothetical protein